MNWCLGSRVSRRCRPVRRLALAVLLGGAPPLTAQELVPTKPSDQRPSLEHPRAGWGSEYTNWVEVSVGKAFVNGNRPEFQRRMQVPAGGLFGGIESLHYEQVIGSNGLFQVDGRGIFDNHDYDLRLDYTHNNLGYVRAGFTEFRTWYDRTGGYFPITGLWITPYETEAAVDRGQVWFEAGLRTPNVPEITLRYEHDFRSGSKDSTRWGDIDTSEDDRRAIVPSFYDLDERRDSIALDARHTLGETEVSGGLRYESWSERDTFFVVRQPYQDTERHVTQEEKTDTDLFNAHAATATALNERLLLTAGYAFTTLDTALGGSRVYGAGFEAVYDPTFRRQLFDEGFLSLDGGTVYHEHLFNVSLLYTPWDNLSLVPALRVSHEDESASADYLLTNLAPGAPPEAVVEPFYGRNDRDYLDLAESLEARYTGLTNWLLYARGEWAQSQGDLFASELDLLTGDDLLQNTDADRLTQKYSLGANWYPLRRLNFSAQYYHKMRDADYDNRPGDSPDSYPGFLQEQNFETDDVNFRVTLRPLNTLTLVTRYDFQLSTIDTRGGDLSSVQSAEVTSHIIGQNVTWSPLPRLFLQGTFDFVLDETRTPANDLTGAAANLVLKAENNYWDAGVLIGYNIDDKTDVQLQYQYYRADNYRNNAAFSQPYGAGAEENGVTATLVRKLSRSVRWTLKYGFFTLHDQTYGGNLEYRAHLVYSSLQYRF